LNPAFALSFLPTAPSADSAKISLYCPSLSPAAAALFAFAYCLHLAVLQLNSY